MATVIYNCKRCKIGRRVDYPLTTRDYASRKISYRLNDDGKQVRSGVWIESCGGGKATVFGGDPLGVCPSCRRAMTYAPLVASIRPEVKCDGRCTGARGHICDCSCGGKNHGAAWAADNGRVYVNQLGAPLAQVVA